MTIPFHLSMTRRTALTALSSAPLVAGLGGLPGGLSPAIGATSPVMLGTIAGNDPSVYLRFATYLGRRPPFALLAFNQSGAAALSSSVPYICGQAKLFQANGAKILWSVPTPGARNLEGIVNLSFDALYQTIFSSILAAEPGTSPIYIRLPWEFNLSGQENAAINKSGSWDPGLFKNAWIHLSHVAKQISPRFQRIWCPNVTTQGIDPALCWPGAGEVEIVSQDFYMQTAYNKVGDAGWFMNEARGLAWGAQFAAYYGKPFGLSEWGMDSDRFAGDFNKVAAWLKGLGTALHHHCWWDRPEAIDCRISDGSHPGLAAAYKTAFPA